MRRGDDFLERKAKVSGNRKFVHIGSNSDQIAMCELRHVATCVGTPQSRVCDGRETLSLFATFTHVMKTDAESQEKLLKYICDTLERAVLNTEHSQVGNHFHLLKVS